jgi:hypothetical protein
MPEKNVPERRTGLRPSEKEHPERSSSAFRHKNTPQYADSKYERKNEVNYTHF